MSPKKKILVIDDEPDIVRLVDIRLKAFGYDVVSAADGEQGIHVLMRERPDLVLLDLMMPKVDGFEFLRRLKGASVREVIPIIMFSAKVRTEDVERALALGANDYIFKPFAAEHLVRRIEAAFRNSGIPPKNS